MGIRTSLVPSLLLLAGTAFGEDITTGLQVHLTFDDSANVADNSGSSFGGTFEASSSDASYDAAGKIGGAAALASGASIEFPGNAGFADGEITVAFWVKTSDFVNATHTLWENGPFDIHLKKWEPTPDMLQLGANLYKDLRWAKNNGDDIPDNDINTGDWKHIVISAAGQPPSQKNHSDLPTKIYVDGVLVVEKTYYGGADLSLPTATDPFIIGGVTLNQILIDDFRWYDRELTEAEVTALYSYTGSSGPADIENLQALAVSHESVQLTWDEVTDAVRYEVKRATDGDFTDVQVLDDNVQTNSYTDNGLEADKTYYYEVNAYDTEL